MFNQFLDMVSLENGKADTVVAAAKDVIQKKELPPDRLYGLGIDGAAVMIGTEFITNQYFTLYENIAAHYLTLFLHKGQVNGVAKELTDSFPKLVSVACAAHRLALAFKDSS